jgi:uncharacterized zinc-type alcohol dehydrogenase-like protein
MNTAATTVRAYAAPDATSPLGPHEIERRAARDHDVIIDIAFCGVCHSDLHVVRNEWGGAKYPVVPGHEIVGTVRAVGPKVTKFKVGQTVGVGCMVDSCRTCASCKDDEEQYCENGFTGTYGGVDKVDGSITHGGYSQAIVTTEEFVLSVPENLDLARVAPLLCAGITTYSPMARWGIKPGDKVGVVGLGGLGHMAVKFGKAFGAEVTVFTTSPSKADDAIALGATNVIISKDPAAMAAAAGTLDFILDTVSASHDYNALLGTLKRHGTLTIVGAPPVPAQIMGFGLIMGRKSMGGSLIGGIAETQEMLDFCGKHEIMSEIELINIDTINDAYERMLKGDVRYRFVIDSKSLSA